MQIWSFSINCYDSAKEYTRCEEYEFFASHKAYGSLKKCTEELIKVLEQYVEDAMDEGELNLGNPNPIELKWTESEFDDKRILKSTWDDYYTLVIFEIDLELEELSIKGYN